MGRTNPTLNHYVSTFIRSFRQRKHLSQEQMADLLNISTRCYQELEERDGGTSGRTICRLLTQLSEEERREFVDGIMENVWP